MSAPLDERYFRWLCRQIRLRLHQDQGKTYWSLLRQLHAKEFVWFVPNDDNRMEDGRDLRYEFLETQMDDTVYPGWLELGCSMLELLIALSRRLSFEGEGEPRYWFWELVNNLQLDEFPDRDYDKSVEQFIDESLDKVIWRTYSSNGEGGLFPLRESSHDQRSVEIWYQLNAYLLERQ